MTSSSSMGSASNYEKVSVPLSSGGHQIDLRWLMTHSSSAMAPKGIRYLQVRNTAAIAGLSDEREQYLEDLPTLKRQFGQMIAPIECELVVECPSCETHAAEFAAVIGTTHCRSERLVFRYDCKNPNRPRAGRGASVGQLADAMFPDASSADLSRIQRVLLIDDVFSEGKTAAAVMQRLWQLGLDSSASISVAVALRVAASAPAKRPDLSEVLPTSRTYKTP